MAHTESGRIVVHLDPMLKRRLYAALAMDNSTLKEWFTKSVERYLKDYAKSSFFESHERPER